MTIKTIIAMLLISLASAAQAEQPQVLIDVQHDSERQVTCWITPQGGISCLPDSQLRQQTHVGANIPASTPAPIQQPEVFQL